PTAPLGSADSGTDKRARYERESGSASPSPGASRSWHRPCKVRHPPRPVEESDAMAATLEPTKTAQGAKPATGTTASDAIRRAKEAGVQVVDVRFTDL